MGIELPINSSNLCWRIYWLLDEWICSFFKRSSGVDVDSCNNWGFKSFCWPPKVFVGHTIYKGKAALTVEPRAPEFVPLESGALKIAREGYILLQFTPAAGVRQYDWRKKQVFSDSVAEIGNLLSLGTKESCEFFHDPNKGKRCSE